MLWQKKHEITMKMRDKSAYMYMYGYLWLMFFKIAHNFV